MFSLLITLTIVCVISMDPRFQGGQILVPKRFNFDKFVDCMIEIGKKDKDIFSDQVDRKDGRQKGKTHDVVLSSSDSLYIFNANKSFEQDNKAATRNRSISFDSVQFESPLLGRVLKKKMARERKKYFETTSDLDASQIRQMLHQLIQENDDLMTKIEEREKHICVLKQNVADLCKKNRRLTANLLISKKVQSDCVCWHHYFQCGNKV